MRSDVRILTGVMLAMLLANCEQEKPAAGGAASAHVAAEIQGIGYVEPASEVRRLAFKSPGIVGECRVEMGRRVKQGDILMSLRNEREAAELAAAESEERLAEVERAQVLSGVNPFQIRTAESDLAIAQCEADYAKREVVRQNQLSKARVASTTEQDRAETDARRREAGLRRAEAVLEHLRNHVRDEDRALAEAKVAAAAARAAAARQRLADTVLRAPRDGTVLEVLRREGESVSETASEPVLIFGDVSRLRVRAEIDETYVSEVRVGQRAMIAGRGLGERTAVGAVVAVKPLMGKKTVFARSATERRDLDVIQVFVEMPEDFQAPVGLEVDVGIERGGAR